MFMDSQVPALIAIMYGNHAPDASILCSELRAVQGQGPPTVTLNKLVHAIKREIPDQEQVRCQGGTLGSKP